MISASASASDDTGGGDGFPHVDSRDGAVGYEGKNRHSITAGGENETSTYSPQEMLKVAGNRCEETER